MTHADRVRGLSLTALLMICAGQVCAAQAVDAAAPYAPPSKAVKLTTRSATVLAEARTAALVAIDVSRAKLVSVDEKNKRVVIAMPGGIRRAVDAEKAKSELSKSMQEWNRFTIVDDPAQADIVVVVFEDTVEPSLFTKSTGDQKSRMRERLAVFARGDTEKPLWADEVRESTLGAITGSPVSKVADKFREALERSASDQRIR